VHPREVFADALIDIASGVVVAHNHPAGSLEPSAWDVEALSGIGQILSGNKPGAGCYRGVLANYGVKKR